MASPHSLEFQWSMTVDQHAQVELSPLQVCQHHMQVFPLSKVVDIKKTSPSYS